MKEFEKVTGFDLDGNIRYSDRSSDDGLFPLPKGEGMEGVMGKFVLIAAWALFVSYFIPASVGSVIVWDLWPFDPTQWGIMWRAMFAGCWGAVIFCAVVERGVRWAEK